MDNLNIYDKVRSVPDNAKKAIQAGRLKGKTDINPMWRIKALTETFGPVGVGWYYKITNKHLEAGGNGEISAFVDIELYVKHDGEWSMPIVGTGGSSFVANERNGAYMSDECFKMALTDAISVSCKALGFGADVYWEADSTKYNKPNANDDNKPAKIDDIKIKALKNLIEVKGSDEKKLLECYKVKSLNDMTIEQYTHAVSILEKR